MNIFLSYGHDDYDKFAYRLKRDLELHGFNVWMDTEKIKETSKWENLIENGINNSDWFIIMMTKHSCRRPNGVCLDEVSYARFIGKNIVPIMIENVTPPLCIARIQYIDMENFFKPGQIKFDEEEYIKKFNILLNTLQGIVEINCEGEYEILRNRLVPLDNDVYYEHFRHNFYGRQELFQYYSEWLLSSSNILWIIGNAGVGKTAFIAKLTENNEEIKAVHFCRYNDSDRANPKRAIMSIAYYLSTQIEEYKNILIELHDLDKLQEKSSERLFAYLLAEPLNKIKKSPGITVIVIDALDEATCEGRNELADIISSKSSILPNWIKIIITSRDDPILRRKLSNIKPISFNDKCIVNNQNDIYGYLKMRLKGIKTTNNKDIIIHSLLKKSENNFLYAKTITDDILNGNISINEYDKFPDGLTGIYISYFERIFNNQKFDYRQNIRPILEILCSEYSPIKSEVILDILEFDEYDFDDIKEEIAQMFPEKQNTIEPIHKSIIDWLIDREKAGNYRVSPQKGHKRIANYYKRMIYKNVINEYNLKYTVRHLINAKMFDDAVDILNNKNFQDKRIKLLGVDTALREYLYEIENLSTFGIAVDEVIYKHSTFINYFCVYRKFLYNTGLYFLLKNNNFDNVLNQKLSDINLNWKVSVTNYLYITERFDLAANTGLKILNELNRSNLDIEIELNNLIGLCYRKSAKANDAKEYFKSALSCDEDEKYNYEKSGAAMNIAKILYHELNWEDAMKYNLVGISLLKEVYNNVTGEDHKQIVELFIAEYYRLTAECLIWKLDIDQALEYLYKSKRIYSKIIFRDRYYTRFIYTSALINIFNGNIEKGIYYCEKAWNIATSTYDKSQILFYKSIALLKNGEMEAAFKCATDSFNKANNIGACLECEEISIIKSIINKKNMIDHTDSYYYNDYIHKWSNYMIKIIEEVIK